jgi:hypothetical protein
VFRDEPLGDHVMVDIARFRITFDFLASPIVMHGENCINAAKAVLQYLGSKEFAGASRGGGGSQKARARGIKVHQQ